MSLYPGFVDPATPLELTVTETVCPSGHVYNKGLSECPWHGSFEPVLIDNE